MLKTEKMIRDDGVELLRTYSDENLKIRQVETGILYDEAVDVDNYTYEETVIKIESEVNNYEGITED